MQSIVLRNNARCPYCGRNFNEISNIERTEEHVIGRRFVPKGYLEGEWNLILDACKECNGYKAKLEDGLSLISQISITDNIEHTSHVQAEIIRKLGKRDPETGKIRGANHPETNRPVANSFIERTISASFGPLTMRFTVSGPPQAVTHEETLARLHIQAFYYLICNIDDDGRGYSRVFTEDSEWLPESCVQVLFVLRHTDWGNESAMELVNRVKEWEIVCRIPSAKGYFKSLIKRDPNNNGYFWALEWNKNIRLLGVIRAPSRPNFIEKELPRSVCIDLGNESRIRPEKPLNEKDDILFKME